tara:strand:- start:116 stop:310 length:195 start_codon:yes stop_codon:yes gene_type:complete
MLIMKSMATGYGKLSSSRFEKFSYGLLKLELMKYSINGKKRFSMIGEENIKIPTILIINPTKKS